MSTTLLPPSNDDDQELDRGQDLKAKKERVIQPLGYSASAPEIPGANEDLLEELRAKTAKLAEKVGGSEGAKNRVLELEGEDPKDIFEEIETSLEKAKHKKKEAEVEKVKPAAADPAVSLIRDKLTRLFNDEPDAAEEAIESYQAGTKRSKHQQFMYELTTSGKSLADIQTEWHQYYIDLPELEKHEVWKEFYDNQRQTSRYAKSRVEATSQESVSPKSAPEKPLPAKVKPLRDTRSAGEIKSQIMNRINADGRLNVKHHIKSLLFGLGMASIVGLLVTFTFFNEVFIAPFISPSHSVSATPIIGNQSGPVGPEPKIIIPKINLEVPVVFNLGSIEEKDIQNALKDGVVHYASTPNPGEKGNAVIVGHSSNNILNSGKYKFAFVLLKRLEVEDTFFIHKDGVRYTYKVYKKEVVGPTETSVLQTQERPNTITLITCDPPGTSINRLIVTAEQISPDPSGNKASTAAISAPTETEKLPSNAPSLWSRLWPF